MTDRETADEPSKGEPPILDDELVARVVGKRRLLGITYLNENGELIEQKQLHGVVEQITKESGIVIRQSDGSIYRLPPDLRGISEAPPGTYRLRATGEEVLVLLCQIAEFLREFIRFASCTSTMPNRPKLTITRVNSPILAGNRAIDLTK
jgi:hypothetical protein